MHEVSLMAEVLSIVETVAQEEGMVAVHKVKLVLGEGLLLMPDSLQFAFDILKKEPIADTATLEMETKEGRVFCVEYIEGE
ncbi:hydrogenase maturation nickel metallochaperone HypA [Laceyella putida]|uniref:Hydrogenase maturation nickel metallochaperone HypA n=1 Tax=Laceyella putida TaxID=110101 RepID=A0ABW2RPL5_9BACL